MSLNQIRMSTNINTTNVNDTTDVNRWNFEGIEDSTKKTVPLSLIKQTENSTKSILKFIITQDLIHAHNTDSNGISQIRKIILLSDQEEIIVDGKRTIQKNYDHLSIILKTGSNQEICLDSSLPKKCNEVVLKLLSTGRPSPKYCCVDFFMDTIGLYSNQTVTNIVGKWQADNYEEASLNTGDGIIIQSRSQKPVHVAIYLTNGIYLSLFGASGPPIATTLNEMKTLFNGVYAYKLTLIET